MAIIINPGITSSGCIVQNDTMEVYGSAVQTIVYSCGSMFIFSGGEATETVVNNGGSMTVSNGGTASNTSVYSFGSMFIFSGGEASNTTVNNGGSMTISGGGVASNTTVNNGGSMTISGGGTATQIRERGGYVSVMDGAEVTFAANTFTGPITGLATVHSNTVASDVLIFSGGQLEVCSGGVASNTTFDRHGTMTVSSGGVASNTTVNNFGNLYVSSGGVAGNTTVDRGSMTVFEGGVASNTIITVGQLYVSGGTAGKTTVNNRGSMTVFEGGVASNTTVNRGSMFISSGGVASGATVESGGRMFVSSGGAADDTTVNYGGRMEVYSGGSASIVFNPWQGTIVSSAGAAVTYLERDANIYFGSDSYFVSKTDLWESGSLGDLETAIVYSGGVANDATVSGGGILLSGGVASNTALDRAVMVVYSGGVAKDTTVIGQVAANIYNLTVSGGGVASNTTVARGADMEVAEGGVARATRVEQGGLLLVRGGTAEEIYECGGWVYEYDGRGTMTFASNTFTGVITGTATVHSNTVASDVRIESGGRLLVYYGGVATGRQEIAEGGNIIAVSGAIIDFAVAGETAGAAALISGWNRITDRGASCTITVAADQASGVYALASGAATFDKTVTVRTAEAELGTLAVGGTLVCGDTSYTLAKADDLLSLTIDGPIPPLPPLTGAEVILTITDPNHGSYGTMGGWKVQSDQTVAWQDLTTLGEGYSYLGLGRFPAGKAMPDIYVYNAGASYIAAYVTDDTGAITGFESIFSGEAALMQVGLADFNADGVTDLLLRTADGFVGYYANGTFSEVQGLGLEWTVAALGDVDGNGRADVVIAHEAGYVGAYLIGNDGSISWADLGNLDGNTRIVGAGDVNGDGTDDVIVQVGANYYGAWTCGNGAVTGFFGIGTFDAEVQDIADYNADGTDDLLLRTAGGIIGAALITGADTTTWAEYGALGAEWSTKGVGIL